MSEADKEPTVDLAVCFVDRLRGLFSQRVKEDVLLIVPCHSIHTFGMKHSIDVAFVDRRGIVIDSIEALPPFRLRKCRGAYGVLERRTPGEVRHAEMPWFEKGEEAKLCIRK